MLLGDDFACKVNKIYFSSSLL